eukprot:3223383-Prymnesium_polylepis.2
MWQRNAKATFVLLTFTSHTCGDAAAMRSRLSRTHACSAPSSGGGGSQGKPAAAMAKRADDKCGTRAGVHIGAFQSSLIATLHVHGNNFLALFTSRI